MGNGATGRSEPLTPLAEDREEWWSADQRGSAPRDRRPRLRCRPQIRPQLLRAREGVSFAQQLHICYMA